MQEMTPQKGHNVLIDSETFNQATNGAKTNISQAKTGTESFYSKNAGSLRPNSSPVEDPRGQAKAAPAKNKGEDDAEENDEKENMNEHLQTLFTGQNLSEEFMSKAAVIFETAVNEKVAKIQEAIEAEAVEVIKGEVEATTQELATKLDEYLSYVVEEWVKENQLAVEAGIRTEIAESFMTGLKELFETHYIEVPEDRVDVLDNLYNENQTLEAKLNEEIEKNLEMSKTLAMLEAREIFVDVASDMTEVDAEKFAALAENIEFNNPEEFANKLTILKENFLKAPVAAEEQIQTGGAVQPLVEDSNMSVYVSALSRHSKK